MPGELDAISALAQQGTQMVTGTLQSLLGTYEYLNARKQAKKNIKPIYNIDPSVYENLASAQSYASSGIPQQALDYYTQQAGRAQSQGIDAILQTGQGGNAISSLVNQTQDNQGKIAAQDAQMKLANVQTARDYNSLLGDARDKAWTINKYQTWSDKAAELSAQMDAGMQNIFGGLNTISGSVANNATQNLYKNGSGNARVSDYGNLYSDYYTQMMTNAQTDAPYPVSSPTVGSTQTQPIFNSTFNTGNSW